jgi:hypothetical protein
VELGYETLLDMVRENKDVMQNLVMQTLTWRFIDVGIDWDRDT